MKQKVFCILQYHSGIVVQNTFCFMFHFIVSFFHWLRTGMSWKICILWRRYPWQ